MCGTHELSSECRAATPTPSGAPEGRHPSDLSELARCLNSQSENATVEQMHALLSYWHIPKLVETGIAVHDDDRDTVELTEAGRTVAESLD